MAIKPDAGILKIKEQIIEDPVTGLSFQFAVVPGSSAPFRPFAPCLEEGDSPKSQ